MMTAFKFIHAADLHIESPYQGVSLMNSLLGKALVERGKASYQKLIQTAIEQEIDFLLIAGDSFDSESGSLHAQYLFVNGLEALEKKNIPVYIICGNHDPFNSWSDNLKLPKNVRLFSSETVQNFTFSRDGKALAEIYGISYKNKEEYRSLAKQYKRKDKATFSIGLLHGSLAGNNNHTPYCPFDLDTLRASKIDYWALGHIHKREIINASKPMAVYPGNIQGRHFNETGKKGCVLIDVKNGEIVENTFIQLSSVIYEYLDLDLSGIDDRFAFIKKIKALKQELAGLDSYLLRLRIIGTTQLHSLLSKQDEINPLIEEINKENDYDNSFVYIDKIINETRPLIDIDEWRSSSDFIADILNQVDEISNNKEQYEKLINEIMEEIKGSKAGRQLSKIEIEEYLKTQQKQLIEDAKWKLLDGLRPQKD